MDLEISENKAGVTAENAHQAKVTKIQSELEDNKKEILACLVRKVDSNLLSDQANTLVNTQQSTIDFLRKQLEFYFGDPNLCKDSFMRDLISKHPKGYVELKTLLSFHKIGQILNAHGINRFEDRLNSLRQAAGSSAILKLCKQNLRIKRKTQFDLNLLKDHSFIEEIDSRTIYVENIPTYANQELIAKVFSKYGRILIVSLPKEAEGKLKKKNKGFAFIEYEVESANRDERSGDERSLVKQQHTQGVYVRCAQYADRTPSRHFKAGVDPPQGGIQESRRMLKR